MHTRPADPSRQGLRPSSRFMYSFIRAAAKTNDRDNILQALNILEHYGLDNILEEVPNLGQRSQGVTRRQNNDQPVGSRLADLAALEDSNLGHLSPDVSHRRDSRQLSYASKLIETLHVVLPQMLDSDDYNQATKSRWNNMLRRTEKT